MSTAILCLCEEDGTPIEGTGVSVGRTSWINFTEVVNNPGLFERFVPITVYDLLYIVDEEWYDEPLIVDCRPFGSFFRDNRESILKTVRDSLDDEEWFNEFTEYYDKILVGLVEQALEKGKFITARW